MLSNQSFVSYMHQAGLPHVEQPASCVIAVREIAQWANSAICQGHSVLETNMSCMCAGLAWGAVDCQLGWHFWLSEQGTWS